MLILSGHHGKVHTLAFSPDGLTLASVAGHGHDIWLWDLLSGMLRAKSPHDRRVVSLAFAPGEEPTMACSDSAGRIGLWQFPAGKETQLAVLPPYLHHRVQVVFSPDGEQLAVVGFSPPLDVPLSARIRWSEVSFRGVTCWDWRAGNEIPLQFRCPSAARLTCVAFSPDGRTIAGGGDTGWAYLWEAGKDQAAPFRLQHGQTIHYLAYAPDGSSFASAGQRGLIKVWDAHTGRKRTTLKGQGNHLHGIAYSPDSATLATASGDGKVRFWDIASGKLRRAFDWGVGQVHSIAFSPDGMRAAAGGDNDIMIWDIDEW